MAQTIKILPAMWEIWVQSLDQDGPLEKGMTTPSRVVLSGEFHRQRSLVGHNPWDCKEFDMRITNNKKNNGLIALLCEHTKSS